MREIVLDIETTGLSAAQGHRIVEIACVELLNLVPTGRTFHRYLNPERDVPAEASRIHGLYEDFLRDFNNFAAIVSDFWDFLSHDAALVIHNAAFDTGFLNYQLSECGQKTLHHLTVTDTLAMARQLFPGSPASLDALCRRFRIDLASREKHGALIDAQLLADVYVELRGGRQTPLAFSELSSTTARLTGAAKPERPFRTPRHFDVSEQERQCHQLFLKDIKNHLWSDLPPPAAHMPPKSTAS